MRRIALLLFTTATLVGLVPQAGAGGSWISVLRGASVGAGGGRQGPDWAGIGALVTMRGGFGTGSAGPVGEGTYEAYLRPETGDDTRIFLGEVVVVAGEHVPFVARTTFVVPEVEPGAYWVDVCTEGCRSGIGDLIGGYLLVGRTAREASLQASVVELRDRLAQERSLVDLRSVVNERLERRLARAEVRLELISLEAKLAEAEQDLAAAQLHDAQVGRANALAADAAARDEAVRWRYTTYLALIVIAVGAWVARTHRRRYVRVRIPDSAAELMESDARRRERS